MGHTTSRVGCRVDMFRISDAPHTRYFDDGTPVLVGTTGGSIIVKHIHEYTMTCPLCGGDGHYDTDEEPVCTECGVILHEDGEARTTNGDPILNDAKSAGRVQ